MVYRQRLCIKEPKASRSKVKRQIPGKTNFALLGNKAGYRRASFL